MMTKDSIHPGRVQGHVHGYFFDPRTGERSGHFEHSNLTAYIAGDILARLLGGDTDFQPKHMGFIYNETGTAPSGFDDPVLARQITWASLGTELADVGGSDGCNVLISPLAAGPGYAVDGDATFYTGNSVTLTAHSGTRLEYGFTTGSPYADALSDGDYMLQALLLNRQEAAGVLTYRPFARVSLKAAGVFPQKPANLEMAVYWSISIF